MLIKFKIQVRVVLSVFKIISSFIGFLIKFFKYDYSRIDSWLKGLNILSKDAIKYVHFGTLYCFDETGTFIPDATKEQSVFNQALSKNMKSAFEDHMIDKYTAKLDALFVK